MWENFGKTKDELRRFGKVARDLEGHAGDAFIHTSGSPDSILLVVSGANNAGVSTVCPSFTVGRTGIGNGTCEIARRTSQ
jgi:hypothetical protein